MIPSISGLVLFNDDDESFWLILRTSCIAKQSGGGGGSGSWDMTGSGRRLNITPDVPYLGQVAQMSESTDHSHMKLTSLKAWLSRRLGLPVYNKR